MKLALQSDFPPALQKVGKKFAKASSTLSYRLAQAKYAKQLPALSAIDREIVDEVNREGIAIRSLEDLGFASTSSLHKACHSLIEDLERPLGSEGMEYSMGFTHCVPAKPSRIAKEYPDLYLWGLDDRILNIIENCIGLPPAYHGVIARKEINDAKQVGSRLWHQDQEDRNIIRISIYLNDIGVDDGPFEYIPKALTPCPSAFKDTNYMASDAAMAKVVPPSQWKACTGSAGTVIFAATAKVFHHGKVPRSNVERIAVSYYYTSQNPTNEELCRTYSFQSGIPFLTHPLNERQRNALWEYKELLPSLEQETVSPNILAVG